MGKRSLCLWNQLHFLRNSHKSLLFPKQNNLKEIWDTVLQTKDKNAEDKNAKINVFPNIPCIFLLFKASAFLQIFFPRNLLFRQVLKTSVFFNSKYLKTSNNRTHIPLFINQFVPLIELKMQRLINYWTNTCKFKIDKMVVKNNVWR